MWCQCADGLVLLQVVIRVRPLNQRELEAGVESCIVLPPGQNNTLHVTSHPPNRPPPLSPKEIPRVLRASLLHRQVEHANF